MALMICPECGTELTKEMIEVNMCYECGFIIDKSLFDENYTEEQSVSVKDLAESIVRQEEIQNLKLSKKISQQLLTSGYNFEGYKIVKYNNVISGQVVMGTGFISEIKAGISDAFGIESKALSNKLEKAKEAALNKLITKSINLSGNAIIGIDYDYITFTNNMMGVSVNGTSVIIEKI